MASTIRACLPSAQSSRASGSLSFARKNRAAPRMIMSAATSLGRKPEPGMESCPVGRSPLSANTSRPTATKAALATWSARMIMRATMSEAGLSLHAADQVDRGLDALGVRVPKFSEVRSVEIVELLAEIGDRGLELVAEGGLLERLVQR